MRVMKRRRIVGSGAGFYHCMSRVVGGEQLLGVREKEVLRAMLWQVAEFCGVEILTYAVMSNHFHVLVRVPAKRAVGDAELVRQYAVLYGKSRSPWQPKPEVLEGLLEENGAEGRAWRQRLEARMGDVSAFMKALKQRFSLWYNHTHGRYGTLWADRFKSVLVEGSAHALMTVAGYIDLNPVRAGLAEDPADYRWCGYGEAMAGVERARAGLSYIDVGGSGDWSAVVARYRRLIFGKGEGGTLEQGKIPRDRVLEVLRRGGSVPVAEALRCRVRYFTDGGVVGSAAFVQAWADTLHPSHRRRRPAEPRPMGGASWEGLAVLRGLRREVYS
jgi:putative transposase